MTGTMPDRCFICDGVVFDRRTPEYRRCCRCGHEVLAGGRQEQCFILNDPLTEKAACSRTLLDRFQAKILHRFMTEFSAGGRLLDIGSASGKFLFHQKDCFDEVFGLEITPEAIQFSRQVLGLTILEDIRDLGDGITIATAWHSFEHMPTQTLIRLLEELSRRMLPGSRLIVSVPNGASLQYRWFGKDYAFYDVPHHLHQFTPTSLKMLLSRYRFSPMRMVCSWPYNVFGYTQSLLNSITGKHNYLYYRLKRRSGKTERLSDLVHLVFLPVVLMLGLILSLLDRRKLDKQGVLTICFEKTS